MQKNKKSKATNKEFTNNKNKVHMKKQMNVLVALLALVGSVFFLMGCQDDDTSKINNRAEKLDYYADVYWSNKPEDLNNEELEDELFQFMTSLSLEELDAWYDKGISQGSSDVDQSSKETVMKMHEESLKKYGMNLFGLTDDQLDEIYDVTSSEETISARQASCPSTSFPLPCSEGTNANWNCTGVRRVTYPGDDDCDWGLSFHVGPMSTTATLKLRGTTWNARQIIKKGGINSRHQYLSREILVDAGRIRAFYLKTGINGFKDDIKAGLNGLI